MLPAHEPALATTHPATGPGTDEIHIKTLTGKTIPVHLKLDSKVEEVKQAICDDEGEG